MRVALIRIREAADTYLSPRKPSVGSSEAPPSAAHVGDMLADLLGGLEGPAPSNRVAPPAPAGTGSWASAGTTAPVATSNETASVSSAGTVPPPPPGTVRVGAAGPASSTPASTRTFPAAGAGRRAGRPRVIVVGCIPRAGSVSWMDPHYPGCPARERITRCFCGRCFGACWLRRRERGGHRGRPDHRLVGRVGRHICSRSDGAYARRCPSVRIRGAIRLGDRCRNEAR